MQVITPESLQEVSFFHSFSIVRLTNFHWARSGQNQLLRFINDLIDDFPMLVVPVEGNDLAHVSLKRIIITSMRYKNVV